MSHVFLHCLLSPQTTTKDDWLNAHEHARTIAAPWTTSHPHPNLILSDVTDLTHAIRLARDLSIGLPGARIALASGPILGHLQDTTRPLSHASRSAEALANLDETAGIFLTSALASMCDSGLLVDHGLALQPCAHPNVLELRLISPPTSESVSSSTQLEMCTRLVEQAIDALESGSKPHLLQKLDEQQDIVFDTLTASAPTSPIECAHILLSLSRWLHPLWMRPEALELCVRFLEDPKLQDKVLHTRLLILRCMQLRKLSQHADTIALVSWVQADTTLPPKLQGHALHELGNAFDLTGDPESALRCYKQAQALAEEHHLGSIHVRVYQSFATQKMMGTSERTEESDAEIFELLEHALSHAQEVGDRQSILRAMGEISNVLIMVDPWRARELILNVLTLARELHIPHYIGVSLGVLTELSLAHGRFLEARLYLEQSRELLSKEDTYGLLILKQQEALVLLHLREYERADALSLELMRSTELVNQPIVLRYAQELSLLSAIGSRRQEQFERLRPVVEPQSPEARASCALGDAIFGRSPQTLEILRGRLTALQHEEEYSNGPKEYVWRLACATFPAQVVPLRNIPTIAVAADATWFIGSSGERVLLARESYLHRIFRTLIEGHAHIEDTGLDTFSLFDIGWAGERISPGAMKNRVYVAIAKLRKSGLQGWLIKGPTGYRLSRTLCVVQVDQEVLIDESASPIKTPPS